MNRRQCHFCSHRAGAFTMVECLIALAISAVLLTAVAVAFNASIINYRENEKMYWTMNNARQALTRMTSQIRTAGYDDPVVGWVAVDTMAPNNHQCNFRTPDGGDFTYEFRSAESKLYLIDNDTTQEYVLCDNVTAATFSLALTPSTDYCKSVQISLTVQDGQDGNFERTLSAAAVVRTNLGKP